MHQVASPTIVRVATRPIVIPASVARNCNGVAVIYAVGQFSGVGFLDIPTMIVLHGVANAFGFACFGLVGWRITCGTKNTIID